MPRDRDEDVSAPLALGPEPSSKPTGSPSKTESEADVIAWGACGVLNTIGELTAVPGCIGIIRYVTSGVSYETPPVEPAWRPMPGETAFELPWAGDPAHARNLEHLRTDLERATRDAKLTNSDHPLLRELDNAAAALLRLVEELHSKGWGIGLVRPDNVFLRNRSGYLEAVLVDLGFTWRGSFGEPPWKDAPGRPEWLEERGRFEWLWDQEADRQQFASPVNGVFPPPGTVADCRTLGRLLAWLITGQTSRTLQALGGDGPTVWGVLSDAAAGRIDSAAELAERLRHDPLSEFIVPPPLAPDPSLRSSRKWLAIAAGVLVVTGIGVGAALWNRGKSNETVQNTPEQLQSSDSPKTVAPQVQPKGRLSPEELNKLLSAFDATLKSGNLEDIFARLKPILKAAPKEQQEAKRKLAFTEWEKAFQDVEKKAESPALRHDAAKEMRLLQEQLRSIYMEYPSTDSAQNEKEKQCLEFVSLRCHELASE
jgi:hypothetical protein